MKKGQITKKVQARRRFVEKLLEELKSSFNIKEFFTEEIIPVIPQYNLYGKRNDKGQIVISVVFTGNEEDIIDSILGSQIKETVKNFKLKREIKK